LNPRLEEKVSNTSKIISEIDSFIQKQIEKISIQAVKFDGNTIRINSNAVLKFDESLLSIFLKSVIEKNLGIELASENIFALVDLLNSQSGKSIQLKDNIIASKERNELIVGRKSSERTQKAIRKIKAGQTLTVDGKIICISKVSKKMFKFTQDKSVEFVSGDTLSDSFEIREWKAGDKFQPIGMKGTKKISDFLSDEKISSLEKKEHLVLTNSGKIVWVIGLRIDERFKVTTETKKILKLTIANK
jgi:tRNA(Ile)-lysidine synthase